LDRKKANIFNRWIQLSPDVEREVHLEVVREVFGGGDQETIRTDANPWIVKWPICSTLGSGQELEPLTTPARACIHARVQPCWAVEDPNNRPTLAFNLFLNPRPTTLTDCFESNSIGGPL
jgi:hypothetical protein